MGAKKRKRKTAARTPAWLRGWRGYVLPPLATLIAVYCVLTWRFQFLHPLRAPSQPAFSPRAEEKLSPERRGHLGWLNNNQHGSFIHRPEKKPDGVLRIGCFGDSVVAGEEVGPDESWPAFLEAELRRAGHRVEVINFGSGGYGAHQSFMLWDFAAQRYELDIVIWGMARYYFRRDSVFLAPWARPGFIQNLHSRFTVRDGRLSLMSLPGATREEVGRRYWGFWPGWTAMRYSRNTPVFIRRLLPQGRQLRFNPFYYDRGSTMREEALKSYGLLLRRMAARAKRVIVLWKGNPPAELLSSELPDNVRVLGQLPLRRPGEPASLLTMPRRHPSALGHRRIARQLSGFLRVEYPGMFGGGPAGGQPEH